MKKLWSPLRFYRESRAYMQGYPQRYFWLHFPKAFLVFYALCLSDAVRKGCGLQAAQ